MNILRHVADRPEFQAALEARTGTRPPAPGAAAPGRSKTTRRRKSLLGPQPLAPRRGSLLGGELEY